MRVLWAVFLLAGSQGLLAAERNPALEVRADELALRVAPKVVAWRRDIHAHPELSNREFRTAALVAAHLPVPLGVGTPLVFSCSAMTP